MSLEDPGYRLVSDHLHGFGGEPERNEVLRKLVLVLDLAVRVDAHHPIATVWCPKNRKIDAVEHIHFANRVPSPGLAGRIDAQVVGGKSFDAVGGGGKNHGSLYAKHVPRNRHGNVLPGIGSVRRPITVPTPLSSFKAIELRRAFHD